MKLPFLSIGMKRGNMSNKNLCISSSVIVHLSNESGSYIIYASRSRGYILLYLLSYLFWNMIKENLLYYLEVVMNVKADPTSFPGYPQSVGKCTDTGRFPTGDMIIS